MFLSFLSLSLFLDIWEAIHENVGRQHSAVMKKPMKSIRTNRRSPKYMKILVLVYYQSEYTLSRSRDEKTNAHTNVLV